MAGQIKGITIEFRGETTSLENALKTVKREANTVTRSLREVDRALKFNPHNVELLTQKQRLLKQRVEETEARVKALKAAQKQLDDRGVDKKSAEYQKLRREILMAENQQKHFTREMIKFGSARLNAIGGQITALGNKLSTVNRRARQVVGSFAAIALYKGFERLKTLDEVSQELSKLGYEGKELEEVMNAATESVSGTKFALTDMSKVAKGALGSGVTDKYDLEEYLGRTADLAQLAGIDVQRMGAMMNKAYSKGKVDARLLNQLNANGIPIYKLLQDELGVTADELSDMTRAGQIGFDDLYKATDKYKGLAQEMGTETFSGAFTVLTQQFGLIGADFLSGVYEPIKEGTKGLVQAIKDLRATGTFKEMGQSFVEFMKPLVEVFKDIIQMSASMPTAVKQFGLFMALFGAPALKAVGAMTTGIGQFGKRVQNLDKSFDSMSKGEAYADAFALIALNVGIAAMGIKDLIEETNDYTRAYQKNADARQQAIDDINTEYWTAQDYALKLEELTDKENKSAEDKKNIKMYVDLLNDSVEGLNLTYDEETDQLNKSTDAIWENIDAMKQQALAAAYKENITEASKDLVKAEQDLAKEEEHLAHLRQLEAEAEKNGSTQTGRLTAEINKSEKRIKGYNKVISSSRGEIDKYSEGYKKATNTVSSETSKMEHSARQNMNKMTEGAKTAGEKFVKGISSGIRENKDKVSSASKSASKSAENSFNPKAYSLGQSWIQGIANGIRGGVTYVKSAVDYATSQLEKRWRENTETESPSRVAMELGDYWTQGLAIGLKRSISALRNASDEVSRTVVGGGQSITNNENKNLSANYTIIVNGTNDPEAYGRYLAEGLKQGMRTI